MSDQGELFYLWVSDDGKVKAPRDGRDEHTLRELIPSAVSDYWEPSVPYTVRIYKRQYFRCERELSMFAQSSDEVAAFFLEWIKNRERV